MKRVGEQFSGNGHGGGIRWESGWRRNGETESHALLMGHCEVSGSFARELSRL